MGIEGLKPDAVLLACAVLLDAVLGDPEYWFHPVRLIGKSLLVFERMLKQFGWTDYVGGFVLFILLAFLWVALPSVFVARVFHSYPAIGFALNIVLVYTLIAMRDLIDHVSKVQRAAAENNLGEARRAVANMVGRDTVVMDFAACRRAAIESLAENFVDGFLTPVIWYLLLGLPGMLLFKVVSTMDSMVGYKTPEYVRLGWCGARLDDLMNYIPARLACLVLCISASFHGNLSARKGWRIGIDQHGLLPGPNPGWSEATMAGLLQRRLIGPIRKNGIVITTVWIGHLADPEAGGHHDVVRAMWIVIVSAVLVIAVSCVLLIAIQRRG